MEMHTYNFERCSNRKLSKRGYNSIQNKASYTKAVKLHKHDKEMGMVSMNNATHNPYTSIK